MHIYALHRIFKQQRLLSLAWKLAMLKQTKIAITKALSSENQIWCRFGFFVWNLFPCLGNHSTVCLSWNSEVRVQELCENRGGRPGLSILTSLTVSMDVKQYWTVLWHWSQFVPNMSTNIRGHKALLQTLDIKQVLKKKKKKKSTKWVNFYYDLIKLWHNAY